MAFFYRNRHFRYEEDPLFLTFQKYLQSTEEACCVYSGVCLKMKETAESFFSFLIQDYMIW